MTNIINQAIGYHFSKKHMANPIFIVGSGRSGTSVLLQALGKHPEIISFPGEAPFLTSIGGNASLYNGSKSDYYHSSLKVDINYLYSFLARLGLESSGGNNYALKNTLKKLISNKNITARTKFWAAKTFPTENVAEGLSKVYKNTSYLYIIRNGIDVVHSMTKFHGFKDRDFECQCERWVRSVNTFSYLHNQANAKVLRHEDLLSNPKNFFSSIFEFLHIDFDEACINFIENNLVHPLDQPDTSSSKVINELNNRENPYLLWPSEQKQIFLKTCSKSMKELNYTIPCT